MMNNEAYGVSNPEETIIIEENEAYDSVHPYETLDGIDKVSVIQDEVETINKNEAYGVNNPIELDDNAAYNSVCHLEDELEIPVQINEAYAEF